MPGHAIDPESSVAVAAPIAVVDPLRQWTTSQLRDLPWRRTRDPWHILVSEVMLQQTQVSRVIDRYEVFLDRFPTASSCATAPTSAVIELWAGLGYNRRAVNLWRAAQVIHEQHAGVFPTTVRELQSLPGVGPYTARAIAVFAYEQDIGVVDTNVGRLLARWTGQSLSPKEAQAMADQLVPPGASWQWNQGLFDFAVAVCSKRKPDCATCGLATACAWQGTGPDPAIASAGVSSTQSSFEGSERQVRGRIVDALRSGPVPWQALSTYGRPDDTQTEVERIATSLIRDGLAVRTGENLELPA